MSPSKLGGMNTAAWYIDAAELVSWPVTLLVLGFYYNSIGVVASWRGVDYASVIATRFDYMVQPVPIFIIPYVYNYLMPIVFVAYSVEQFGVQGCLGVVRRFYLTQTTLLLSSYALFIIFPVGISSIAWARPPATAGFLTHYTYSFVQLGMCTFNSFPSMHVASTLSIAWIQRAESLPGATFALAFAVTTFFSTVLTRAHFIADVPGGMLLALAVDAVVYRPLKRREQRLFGDQRSHGGSSSSSAPSVTALLLRAAAVVAAPALAQWGKEALADATGTRVDVNHMARMLLGTI